jgi:bacillithiol biosynthesis deacetylase BshB1
MILLAFGAHPDDVELAAAGTLANAVDHGHRVVIADLTRGERATAGTAEIRAREALAAARVLGVERVNLGLPDADLDRSDPAQKLALVEVMRRVRPDLVIAPIGRDPHPDHRETHHLVRRASYLAGLSGYAAQGAPHRPSLILFYPASRETLPRAHVVVDVGATLERKMEALACYASQFVRAPGGPATPINAEGFLERVRARGAVAGLEIGVAYGEAFLADRPLGVRDPLATLGLKAGDPGRSQA